MISSSLRKTSRCLFAFFCGTVAGLAPSSSRAGIVFFDVPEITISPNQSVGPTQSVTFADINLTNGTYTIGYTAEARSGLWMVFVVNESGWFFEGGPGFGMAIADGTSDALLLNYGDPIQPPYISSWGGVVSSSGAWSSGGTGYAALLIGILDQAEDRNYGWVALDYSPAGTNSALTISGFAFEADQGQSIFAGAGGPPPGPSSVPEPGTWAAAALLVGGAALLRWRKRK